MQGLERSPQPLRERPQPPRPSEVDQARKVNEIWRYLEESGLQRCAESLCVDTLRQAHTFKTAGPLTVPVNPYPTFSQRLRQLAQRQGMLKLSNEERFKTAVSFPTTVTAVRYVAGARGHSHVWGIPSILRCVSPQEMRQYQWLLEDVTPLLSKLGNHSPYTIQVACSLSGPCVFSGTLLPASPALCLDLLQIYIIAGPDPHRARVLFAHCLRQDVVRMSEQDRHRVLRITVPTDGKSGMKVFSKEEVSLAHSGFEEAVQSCLDNDREGVVKVQCVWRVDPQGLRYQVGSKAYCLTIIQTASDRQEKERVLSFPQRPLLFLCCSVFPQQAQAEAYTRAHTPAYTAESVLDVFAPVRDILVRRLSTLNLPQDALPAAHLCCMFLLLLPEGDDHTHSTVTQTPPLEVAACVTMFPFVCGSLCQALEQLHRFLHSPAAGLWALRQYTLSLCHFLESRPESMDVEICAVITSQLQELLLRYLTESEPDDSWCSDSRHSLDSLRSQLQAACSQLVNGPRHAALTQLKEWYWSSSVLECQLVSDSLPWVPVLKDMTQKAEPGAGASEVAVSHPTGSQQHSSVAQRSVWEQELLYCTECTVELSPSRDPSHLMGALSQYLVDCEVDRCWERCLWSILSVSPLPCNPYPSLVQEFKLSALRRSLWRQSDAELLKQVLSPQPPEACTPGGLLHRGPGGEGFGLQSALKASNPDRIRDCLSRAHRLECNPRHAGRFKVERSIAVVSPGAWLGTLSPFLCGLQVVEFCYIRAPPGCVDEVLQVYAKLVLAELSELAGKDGLTPYTVHLGPGQTWNMQQVAAFPTHFQECFSEALRQRHPVHLQVFQTPCGNAQWRFLPLQMRFVLYCLHEDGSMWLCLPQHDPLLLYQAVFKSLDQATFHLCTVGGDPFSSGSLQEAMSEVDSQITDGFLRGDILQGYRLVALRCLLTGEEACLPACWRMCHSVCAQLEFLSSMAECLQGLLEICEAGEHSTLRQKDKSYQAAVEGMFEGFTWLLQLSLQHPGTLAPPGLWETVLNWQEFDTRGSRALWVRGMVGVCRAVSEGLSHDLHSLCPQVQALLDRLGTAGENGEVRTQVCHTKIIPPHSQPQTYCSPAYYSQKASHSTHLTGAQALDLF